MRVSVLALVLVLAAGVARAEDEQTKIAKILLDDSARVADREAALNSALPLVLRTSPPHPGPIADAMRPLLERLKQRVKDKSYERFIVSVLKAVDTFTPFPDLGPVVRPYLSAEAPRPIRRQALDAIAYNGAAGVGADLEAMLKEPEAEDTGGRQAFERSVLDAALATPPADCARVCALALEQSRFRAIQRGAAHGLGEKRCPEGRAALVKALAAPNPDDVQCAIATALVRNGSLEGVAELSKKLKKRPSREVYRTFCEIAYRPEGFKNVPPDRFYEVEGSSRAAAVGAILEWWKANGGRNPDQLLFDAIRASGIKIPDDPNDKGVVAALIEALTLDPPGLRYTAFDLLVRKTDQKELAKDFNVLKTTAGQNTSIYETEPREGFEDAARRARIKEEQKEKIEKWRQWWRTASVKATLVDGVWRTS